MASGEACQICGRRVGARQDGTLRLHHVRSDACAGSGRKPFAVACDAIDEGIARLAEESRGWTAWWARYYRGNMPPADAERAATARVEGELARLVRRRKAWERRDWIEYWDGETERFRKRPPEPGERGYPATSAEPPAGPPS